MPLECGALAAASRRTPKILVAFLVLFAISAYALNGRPDEALDVLERVAKMGFDYPAAKDENLLSLRGSTRFPAVIERFAENAQTTGNPVLAFTLEESGLIPEGLAWDPLQMATCSSATAPRRSPPPCPRRRLAPRRRRPLFSKPAYADRCAKRHESESHRPHDLSGDGHSITEVTTMAANSPLMSDLTLSVLHDGWFFFNANGQWDLFDDSLQPKKDAHFENLRALKIRVK